MAAATTSKILLFAILQANINVVVKLRTPVVFVLHRIFFIYFLMVVRLTCEIFEQKISNVWQLSHSFPPRSAMPTIPLPPVRRVVVCDTLLPSLLPPPPTISNHFTINIFHSNLHFVCIWWCLSPITPIFTTNLELNKMCVLYDTHTHTEVQEEKNERKKYAGNYI